MQNVAVRTHPCLVRASDGTAVTADRQPSECRQLHLHGRSCRGDGLTISSDDVDGDAVLPTTQRPGGEEPAFVELVRHLMLGPPNVTVDEKVDVIHVNASARFNGCTPDDGLLEDVARLDG